MTLISEHICIARKQHRCEECGGVIYPRERYLRQANTDGGSLYTFKAHDDCAAATVAYAALSNFYWDEWFPIYDLPIEDSGWIWAEFPRVAERIRAPALSWAHRFINRLPL